MTSGFQPPVGQSLADFRLVACVRLMPTLMDAGAVHHDDDLARKALSLWVFAVDGLEDELVGALGGKFKGCPAVPTEHGLIRHRAQSSEGGAAMDGVLRAVTRRV